MNAQRPRPVRELPKAYRVPRSERPIDLKVDANEGSPPPASLMGVLAQLGPEQLTHYPSAARLEARIAREHGVQPHQVLITAGADEAIDRLCRTFLSPERNLVMPVPTFVMIGHYSRLAGAVARTIPWLGGAYPTAEVLEAVDEDTALITVVSPNNPTGGVATLEEVQTLSKAAPHAIILLDLAYVEYADTDITAAALEFPNVVVTRTFSKAYGLAGLRVGYALGDPQIIEWLRAAAGPFPVSTPSLRIAEHWLDTGATLMQDRVARVRTERDAILAALQKLGAHAIPSQGNFVFTTLPHTSLWVWEALASLGIAVRRFPGAPHLDTSLRISCPCSDVGLTRILHALRAALTPEALLFDMDGVLVDVSGSYRAAIVETAASWGVTLTAEHIRAAKNRGNANNDWVLTRELLREIGGIEASLDEVTQRFEALYQGTPDAPGLKSTETCLVTPELLHALRERGWSLGVVTGRPRRDAAYFLEQHNLTAFFDAVICMEDGPAKPNPAPVQLALEKLGVERAWLLGDTPDDIRAARSAGVIPLGIIPPGEADPELPKAMERAGVSRIIPRLEHLLEILP